MSQSIIESHKILNCKCCKPVSVFDNNTQKPTDVEGPSKKDAFKEHQGVETISASHENLAILMELLMYHGKDVNIVEMF